MSRIKNEAKSFCTNLPLPQIIFIYLTRMLLLFSCVSADSKEKSVLSLAALLLTYLVSFLHIISKKGSFLNSLNHRITTLISLSSLVSCFIGQTLGVLQKHEEYDILMSAVTGVAGTLFGYYVTLALRNIKEKRDCAFTVSSSLFISGTIVFFREMIEFFIDFRFGTNITHAEFIEDDHWLFKLLGFGNSVREQRPLYDTDEDMLISLIFSAFTTVALYLYLRFSHKELFGKTSKRKNLFKNLPQKISDKIYFEAEKVKQQTDIYDILVWWLTRTAMVYAIFNMEDTYKMVLVGANLLATFAISLLHLVFPKDSLFYKINYRMQTWLCLLVFTGSYMGNFMFVYNYLPRFDLFLHFISGPICVAGGYYVASAFFKADTKKNVLLTVIYAFCLSCFVMPFWEVFEFCGDFLFGSANQGYYWVPSDDSFFFKLFGHGAGNTMLYSLFDTVYDVLLAFFATAVSLVCLHIHLSSKLKKKESAVTQKRVIDEKSAVKC